MFFFKENQIKALFFGGVKIRYPTQHEKNRSPKGFSVVVAKKNKEIGFRALSETLVDGQVVLGEVREAAGNPPPTNLVSGANLLLVSRSFFLK